MAMLFVPSYCAGAKRLARGRKRRRAQRRHALTPAHETPVDQTPVPANKDAVGAKPPRRQDGSGITSMPDCSTIQRHPGVAGNAAQTTASPIRTIRRRYAARLASRTSYQTPVGCQVLPLTWACQPGHACPNRPRPSPRPRVGHDIEATFTLRSQGSIRAFPIRLGLGPAPAPRLG
jgi:hypothetical protein